MATWTPLCCWDVFVKNYHIVKLLELWLYHSHARMLNNFWHAFLLMPFWYLFILYHYGVVLLEPVNYLVCLVCFSVCQLLVLTMDPLDCISCLNLSFDVAVFSATSSIVHFLQQIHQVSHPPKSLCSSWYRNPDLSPCHWLLPKATNPCWYSKSPWDNIHQASSTSWHWHIHPILTIDVFL